MGGGFRIPDVIERSGAFLRAVGSTNRVRVDDYQRAITPSTGLLLKVHPSNFRVEGFAEEATLESLVALGRASDVPVMHDLGSGLLAEETLPMLQEPSVRSSVAAGAELVTWSGDKLLGGPQAGIIDGRATTMERLRSNPLLRAFRVDKMTLAALEKTLRSYLAPERALVEIPVLRMLGEPAEEVERRARDTMELLSAGAARHISVAPMRSVLGGGSAPGFEIASAGWVVSGPAMVLESKLRQGDPPVVGRIAEGELHLDFRTIVEEQQRLLAAAVDRLFAKEDAE
ncbi:MAG: L-seryl-tRNA(Sec) selenium transferase [Gemmatimonadetes bacterium]|nr:L-seryl-tRNA(Sec) selenium transferase [Gemmatimonadota bacterium]